MKNITWQTKSSTPKYKNPWIEVTEDIVIDEKGNEKMYGVVNLKQGSCTLPIDTEGFVYLTKQYRYGLGEYSIEGPGGVMDPGETPLETAKRELKEELGIEGKEWIPLGHVCGLTSVIKHTEHLFIVRDCAIPRELPYSEEEQIELVRVTLKKAIEMAMKSEIIHAPTVALILRAEKCLRI